MKIKWKKEDDKASTGRKNEVKKERKKERKKQMK